MNALRDFEKTLKEEPSSMAWERMLWRIVLDGGRVTPDDQGTASYIRSLWDQSHDQPDSRAGFHQGLRDFTASWDVKEPRPPTQISRFLSLLIAFRPPNGLLKVGEMMSPIRPFAISKGLDPNDIDTSGGNLHQLLLDALDAYYPPVEPAFQTPDYKEYIAILQRHLDSKLFNNYSAYAGAKLLDLYALKVKDTRIRQLIANTPDSLNMILTVLFDPKHFDQIESNMFYVYSHCLSQTGFALFDEAVRRKGWTFNYMEKTLSRRRQVLFLKPNNDYDAGRTLIYLDRGSSEKIATEISKIQIALRN